MDWVKKLFYACLLILLAMILLSRAINLLKLLKTAHKPWKTLLEPAHLTEQQKPNHTTKTRKSQDQNPFQDTYDTGLNQPTINPQNRKITGGGRLIRTQKLAHRKNRCDGFE